MSRKTNPLEIPEIIRLIGRYVEKSSEIAVMNVSRTFHSQVSATVWESIGVDFANKTLYRPNGRDKGRHRLLPWKSLELYGPHVRTIELASHGHPLRVPPAS